MTMEKRQIDFSEQATLAYDLRQRRAKLIADCMDDVIEACKADSYNTWLKNIDDLFSVSLHTFSDKDKCKITYSSIRSRVTGLANQYPNVWLQQTKDSKACALIENTLRDLFEFVMDELEESGVFGKGYEYDEDEI